MESCTQIGSIVDNFADRRKDKMDNGNNSHKIKHGNLRFWPQTPSIHTLYDENIMDQQRQRLYFQMIQEYAYKTNKKQQHSCSIFIQSIVNYVYSVPVFLFLFKNSGLRKARKAGIIRTFMFIFVHL